MTRCLIVNADDLGQSDGVNRGIFAAVEGGIVTSASLMVRWPAAEAAAAWCRSHPQVSVGLHLDLGEWVCRDGEWMPLYHVVDNAQAAAVAEELSVQLDRCVRLLGRPPTHLDSHQHVHRREPVRSLVLAAAARLGIPVRDVTPAIAYNGGFYGQTGRGEPYPDGVTVEALLGLVDSLPEGTTELGCHPGADNLDDVDSPYLAERAVERRVLCDPALPSALRARGVTLSSF